MGMIGGEESIPVIGESLRDPDRCVRFVAEIAFADLTRRQLGVAQGKSLDSIRRHIDGHRYGKAGKMLDELTATAPSFADAWHLRGIVAFCVGQYGGGKKFARCAIEINRYHFAAHTLVARCWLELERPDQALVCFEKSFAINPSQTAVLGYIDVLKRNAGRLNLDDSA
jgi:tetratricopeptide (TPR) repeat protein